MNWLRIGDTLLNLDAVISVQLNESAELLVLQTLHQGEIKLPLDDAARAAYDWLQTQTLAQFDGVPETAELAGHGLPSDAWRLMVKIDYTTRRTGVRAMTLDDEDIPASIKLEHLGYIATNVHDAWLMPAGRDILAEYGPNRESAPSNTDNDAEQVATIDSLVDD